jgi:hypothetical protein
MDWTAKFYPQMEKLDKNNRKSRIYCLAGSIGNLPGTSAPALASSSFSRFLLYYQPSALWGIFVAKSLDA